MVAIAKTGRGRSVTPGMPTAGASERTFVTSSGACRADSRPKPPQRRVDDSVKFGVDDARHVHGTFTIGYQVDQPEVVQDTADMHVRGNVDRVGVGKAVVENAQQQVDPQVRDLGDRSRQTRGSAAAPREPGLHPTRSSRDRRRTVIRCGEISRSAIQPSTNPSGPTELSTDASPTASPEASAAGMSRLSRSSSRATAAAWLPYHCMRWSSVCRPLGLGHDFLRFRIRSCLVTITHDLSGREIRNSNGLSPRD